MDSVLGGVLCKECVVYLDDVLIHDISVCVKFFKGRFGKNYSDWPQVASCEMSFYADGSWAIR